jgi:hypothetical protein
MTDLRKVTKEVLMRHADLEKLMADQRANTFPLGPLNPITKIIPGEIRSNDLISVTIEALEETPGIVPESNASIVKSSKVKV